MLVLPFVSLLMVLMLVETGATVLAYNLITLLAATLTDVSI